MVFHHYPLYLNFVKIGSLWIFLIYFLTSTVSVAHQPHEGSVYGTVGPFAYQTHAIYSKNTDYDPFLLGLAVFGEADLNEHGGVEIGLFYTFKTYQRVWDNSFVSARVHKFDVPAGYRHWFTPAFSAALSLSSLFTIGDTQVQYNGLKSGNQGTLANAIIDYAINVSLQWEAWSRGAFTVLLDGRYDFSISTNVGEDANQYGLLVGLKYLIQEK
jgi:hypothetical protein